VPAIALPLERTPQSTEQPVSAAPNAAPAAIDPLFASPTRLDRVGRIVAPVYINGQGPFRLVVDTGASHSTISPQLAERLALSPAESSAILLNGVTGTAQVPAVNVQRMQAGDLVIQNAQVPVVWSSIMAGADGILGVAGLRRERILVDFRKDRILISQSQPPDDLSRYLKVPARRVAGGLLAVDVRVGSVRARAIIDTGSERTLGNTALLNALHKRHEAQRTVATKVFGATTDVSEGQQQVAPTIVFGAATLTDVTVVFGDFHIFKVWDLEQRPALLIGMDVLGTVQVLVIDFKRGELHLKS
jgi:predicted aspartyl protease